MNWNLLDLEDDAGSPPSSGEGDGAPVTVVGSGATLAQPQGTGRRYGLDLVDPADGSSLLGVFGDGTPTRCAVWAGEGAAVAAAPATAWASSADGQLYLTIAPADLAALECQPYPLRVEASRGGEWQEVWAGWLDVLPGRAAVAGPPPRVYCSYRDLLKYGGDSVGKLRSVAEGAGFLSSRVEAREWVDSVVLAHWRPPGFGGDGFGSSFDVATGLTLALDAPSDWLRGILDAGGLLLRDLVVHLAARKALAILFGRQTDPGWLERSAVEHDNADNLIAQLVAEIDLNADGRADLTINCGTFNARSI